MDRIDTMNAFVTVAREGGFTKAGDKLGMSNQLVSKYVSHLEDQLGVRLFNRTTRKVHLTEAGEQCYIQSLEILESYQDMEGRLGQLQNQAQGLLNISAPVSFATMHLPRLLNDFREQHPAVNINVQLNDRKVDVVEEGFDLALRIGQLKDSSLIAKALAPVNLVLCASPDYLAQYGEPKTPQDLIPQHHLRYSYMEFEQSQSELIMALKSSAKGRHNAMTANNGEILTEAAIAGQGYVIQPTFIVSQALKSGKLKVILPEYAPKPHTLYAVYPHRKLLATKLRAFLDFAGPYYGETPYWDVF